MMTMRPNKIGWVLTVFFLVGGILFAMVDQTRLLGSIWIVVSVFLIGLNTFMERKVAKEVAFRRDATPARVKVTDLPTRG